MADTLDVDARELDPAEWTELVEAMAQHYFQMSAEQFRAAWEAGEFDDDLRHSKAERLAILLPFDLGSPSMAKDAKQLADEFRDEAQRLLQAAELLHPKARRGRPKGSKNKPRPNSK